MPTFRNFFIFLTLFALSSLAATALGQQTNYFSYVFSCPGNQNGQKDIELLDFYESRILRNQVPTFSLGDTEDHQLMLEELFRRLEKISPVRALKYKNDFNKFWKEAVLSTNQQIIAPLEMDNLLFKPGCEILPVAVMLYKRSPDLTQTKILVNESLWMQLQAYEKISVILSFVIASELNSPNLINARAFNAYWFSDDLSRFDFPTWINFLKTLSFKSFDYLNFQIDLNRNFNYFSDFSLQEAYLYAGSDNVLKIDNQLVILEDKVVFDQTGQILSAHSQINFKNGVETNFLKVKVGLGELHLVGNKNVSPLKFFPGFRGEALYGQVSNKIVLPYESHTLKLLSNYSELAFWSPRKIRRISLSGASLKIGKNVYNVGSQHINSSIFFYESGELECAEHFQPNQVFQYENGRIMTSKYMTGRLCFSKEGYLKTDEASSKAPSSYYPFYNNGNWNHY